MTKDKPPSPSLDELDARLQAAQRDQERAGWRRPRKDAGSQSGMGMAFRVASELVAGVAVGVLIGWLLDSWLETRPWFMIVFFFLGAAAGMLNVYRTVSGYGLAVGYRREAEENPATDIDRDDDAPSR